MVNGKDSGVARQCGVMQGVSANSEFWRKLVWVIGWLFYDGVKGKYRQVKYEWKTRKRV